MFSKKRADTLAVVDVPAPRTSVQRKSIPSLIGADVLIKGRVTSSGEVTVDGRIEGDMCVSKLIIGEGGAVNGAIFAQEIVVRGSVQGDIRARNVLLGATSRVRGDILHKAFAVEAGASFEGNCRHSEDPLATETSRSAEPVRKPLRVSVAK